MSSDYLFPKRLSRRDFIKLGAVAAAATGVPSLARAQSDGPVKIGTGKWTYTLDESWGKLPEGMNFGLGCGIVVDSKDRVIVTSRSANPCVAIYSADGKLEETWSNDFAQNVGLSTGEVAGTAHCIYWSKEPGGEFFYFTENVGKAADGKAIGKRVYKTDLKGKVLYTIGNVETEDSTHQKFDWTNPTDVAVAPNGDIYVVDGYGSQRVSRFDKNFKHIKTFGGKGTTNDTFNTCHGIWVCTLRSEPEVYIADRANARLQVYDLELNYKRTIKADWLKNPCCFYQHAGHLYIPDLASKVGIINAADETVAVLGDGTTVPEGGMKAKPAMDAMYRDKFFAPHAMTVDSKGNFYVVEWVSWGRVRKFTHTPA
jgi:peptidylamidoglycolate lyase